MGRAVIDAAAGRDDIEIVAAVDRAEARLIGEAGRARRGRATDLSSPPASAWPTSTSTSRRRPRRVAVATRARQCAAPAVIGTTGLDADDEAAIAALAKVAPIVVAANFSLGVNLLLGLVEQAARALGPEWDAEVVETHHRAKRDAPSGTALMIARRSPRATAPTTTRSSATRATATSVRVRAARSAWPRCAAAMSSASTPPFFGPGERIEITHRATSRAIFAAGALRAAAWVVGKPPGRYDMLDVLGLR